MRFEYNDNIPTLDLSDFTNGSPEKRINFTKDLGEIYSEIGFVAIKNHGFSQDVQKNILN